MNEEMTPIEEMTFRQASVELERIVRSLESGDLELEDALAQYTRGVALLKFLRSRLADAEQQMQETLDNGQPAGEIDTTAAPAASFMND